MPPPSSKIIYFAALVIDQGGTMFLGPNLVLLQVNYTCFYSSLSWSCRGLHKKTDVENPINVTFSIFFLRKWKVMAGIHNLPSNIITTEDYMPAQTYVGLTETPFKARFANHKSYRVQ